MPQVPSTISFVLPFFRPPSTCPSPRFFPLPLIFPFLLPLLPPAFFLLFLGRAFLTIPLHPARNANGRVNLTKVQYADGGVGSKKEGGRGDYGTFKFTNSVELVARQLD